MEVLEGVDRISRTKEENIGFRVLLEIAHDKKSRLAFKGPMDHAVDRIVSTSFPIYVKCTHGHHKNLADTFETVGGDYQAVAFLLFRDGVGG